MPAPPEDGRNYHVFLAYNSKDEDAKLRTRLICAALSGSELDVWFDKTSVERGQPSVTEMRDGLTSSRCCFMLQGAKGFGQWQDRFEAKMAIDLAVRNRLVVCPVLLPGAQETALPLELQIYSRIDLRAGFDGDKLTDAALVELLATAHGKSPEEFQREREAVRIEAMTGRSRALLVGVSTYSDPDLKALHGPHQDVLQLRQALEHVGAPVGDEWEFVAVDDDPDHKTLQAALDEFFTAGDADLDTVLFYYSGHGILDRDDSYISATDTDAEHPSLKAVSAHQIADYISASNAASKIVILDCCHGARLQDPEFDALEDKDAAAVILATRGPADAAAVVSETSPFTRNLIGVLGDANSFRQGGLNVGDLCRALEVRREKPWTNKHCADDIVVAIQPAHSEAQVIEAGPEVTLEISGDLIDDERLPLVRQLTATLDGLLALAPAEDEVPPVVCETVDMLAHELARLVPAEQLKRVDDVLGVGSEVLPTCCVRFKDEQAHAKLRDLPWEYLSVRRSEIAGHARIRMGVVRVFPAAPTKQARPPLPQRVALLSSFGGFDDESRRLLPVETTNQLKNLRLALDEDSGPLTWTQFRNSPDWADVVVLQAPLRLVGDEVKMLFVGKSARDPKPTSWTEVAEVLERRRALSWLLIETVADDSLSRSAFAVRRLAVELATKLARPVVGICHTSAYLSCLETDPPGTAFTAHLLSQLNAGQPLERAAAVARREVSGTVGIDDPAVIGMPIVMRPVVNEPLQAQRPVAVRS
jgi:hypothetical protein